MSKEELKSLLHESIENIDDDSLLVAMQEMLNIKYQGIDKPLLSAEQLASLDEAKKEILAGRFLTNEEANNLSEKWLSL
jgi:hypothetical protein